MAPKLRRLAAALLPYGLLVLVGGAAALVVVRELRRARGVHELVFHDPWALLLLGACALCAWVGFHLDLQRSPTFGFSRVEDLAHAGRGPIAWLAPVPRALRIVTVGVLAVALARPQTMHRQEIEVEGIDLMVVLDISRSMEDDDLVRNRLDAAQRTIRRFVEGRKNDRVGLVVFAKEAMLQCPLTLDYAALDAIVSAVAIGDLDPAGTAIGDGLALATASLRRSDARSKVVVLLTDGDSNVVREFDPDQAKELARQSGIRVFTVLIGREADAVPGFDPFGPKPYAVNPELLKRIAAETGGRYFNAPDTRALDRGFEEVRATLEKSKRREVGKVYGEAFPHLALLAFGLLALEVLLTQTRFRTFP